MLKKKLPQQMLYCITFPYIANFFYKMFSKLSQKIDCLYSVNNIRGYKERQHNYGSL
jgi:hypothetical protein